VSGEGKSPYERASYWVLLFVGLLAAAIAYPDGFELVALAAAVVVLIAWIVLLIVHRDADG
jgi:hypothetical protein